VLVLLSLGLKTILLFVNCKQRKQKIKINKKRMRRMGYLVKWMDRKRPTVGLYVAMVINRVAILNFQQQIAAKHDVISDFFILLAHRCTASRSWRKPGGMTLRKILILLSDFYHAIHICGWMRSDD
jgi:hypothetical protein